MATSILHCVHDPLCGWCYAASSMVEAVANAGIPIVLHGGGLWETPTGVAPDKRAYIQRSDARIAELTGERLHVEQPPLSRAIKELEEDLGAQLFVRTTRSTRLTRAGKLFLDN
jgi:protein-disulfide isomerase-like protein with CxxC motif